MFICWKPWLHIIIAARPTTTFQTSTTDYIELYSTEHD